MSFKRLGRFCLAGFVIAAAAVSAHGAVNHPTPQLSREQVNPAAQSQQRRQRPTDVFSGPQPEVCQLSDDPGLGFVFRSGAIEDPSKVLSERDKQTAWGEALGRKITPFELCEIRDRLAQRIFRKGVLARVIIPPQTISGGMVKFHVIAAKIVSVRFDGDDVGPSQGKVEAYLNHLRQQNTFNLDTAQRWLLLVNDIPGIQATAKIVHSAAPGAPPEGLDLVVTVKRTAVDEFGEVSNVNANSLGPWSGIARVDFNSLTGLGERTSVIAYSTLGNNSQQVAQLLETVKIGDSGLFGAASFAFGHSRPGDVLKPLNLTGESFSGTIELDYPLIRLQRRNLALATGMDFLNQTTTFATGQALADDTLRVVWARADASAIAVDRPVMDNLVSSAVDISLQVRKGLNVLGASVAGAQSLSRPQGRADAWVVRAEGHASLRVTPDNPKFLPITFSLHFMGQWADRPLLAYEEQAIGNLSIGRGYDPDAASGDRVAAGEFKFELGPIKLTKTARITPYVFDDLMRVTNLDIGAQDVTLRSVGGGVELRFPYDARGDAVRVDFGYAKPLDKTFPAQAKKPPERWLLQVVVAH
jgi:hemolysin activation/secretion protein